MSVIYEEKVNSIDVRSLVLPCGAICGLALLFFRLWYFQVVQSESLAAEALRGRTTAVKTIAPRGMIVDRNGAVLAGVREEYVVTGVPKLALTDPKLISRVASILNIEPKDIKKALEKGKWRPYISTPIAQHISAASATKIAELGNFDSNISKAFRVEKYPMRYYNEPVSFSHIIGYVKPPSQTDLDRLKALKIDAATYVGKQGLEKAFEADLMGTPGQERLEVDSKRRIQRSQGTDAEIPGTKLTLSIDARLQKLAFEALGGYNGSVVAIEPSTGEVLCLASKPSFDSSLFLGQLSPEEYKNLADDPEKPLYNRALREAYAPGSTFKTVTALAAYIAGKFDPNWTAYCNGSLKLGKGKPIKCLGHHGAISFNRAYAKSCNVYFMQLGYQQAGLAALRKASEIMGIGEKSGIDLGGEYAGTVPSEKFIRKLDRWNYIARERQKNPKLKSEDVKYQGKDQMYGGEIAQFAIGQGMVSSTAVQMANVAAFVANRGFAYTPHVVRAKNGVKVQSVIGHSVKANDAFWTSLIRAMQDVVDSGTAIRSRIAGITMAGKTGSAEVQGQHITNSWFIAFAPVDRPRIAIAVMAEKAGHGSDVAAPIGSSIVAAYLRNTYPASTTPNGAPAFLQPKGPAVVVTSLDPGTGDGEN